MKVAKIALSIACMTASATAVADTTDIVAVTNQVGSIQLISTSVNYTETANGTTADTESGSVPGYALSLSTMQDLWLGNDYIQVEYDHNSGHPNYIGAPLGGGAYGSVLGQSGATLANYSARYGTGFVIGDEAMLTPYIEIGHHSWDRGVNYGETYTHNYYGVGALGQCTSPVSGLVFTANALIGSTFGSNIDVGSGPGLTGFSGALGNSTLYKFGLSADYAFTQNFHGNIGADYTSFKYGMSAVYGAYYEPDSKTSYTTLKVGLGYAF